MRKISILLAALPVVLSCSSLSQVESLAKFEQASKNKGCRIENLKAIKGTGKLIFGLCDGEPHLYAEKNGKKIDLTANCENFDKAMEIYVRNYEIMSVVILKDRTRYYPATKEVFSLNTLNFFYIKSALEYLKEKQCEKIKLYSKECLLW